LLDVRTKSEYAKGHIGNSINMPLDEVSKKIDQLNKSKEIVTCCGVGLRAAHAHRILKNTGFENTKFMEGSMSAWPYNTD
jgi:phage shock protein E